MGLKLGAPSASALSATFAPAKAARPGSRLVCLGDSTTAGANDNANQTNGMSWPTVVQTYGGGKIDLVRNAGVSGDTTAAMLARFDTDVTPYAPNVVVLHAGRNDVSVTAFATWQATMETILAKIRAIGATPVLATINATDSVSPTDTKQRISLFNQWIRTKANREGIALLDFYKVLVEPTTGGYKAGYTSDNVHTTDVGTKAMGQYAAPILAALMPPGGIPLCLTNGDEVNIITNGCFASGTGSALPSGFSDGSGTPAGSVISYDTDSEVPGKLLTLTHTAVASARSIVYASYIGQTTLTNAITAGATSLVIPVRADFGGVLYLNPGGANEEIVKISSSTGAGPQTETLVRGVRYAHSAGEPVYINAMPGDTLMYCGLITSDGGVTVSATTNMPGGSHSPAPLAAATLNVTRGVFARRFTVPTGTNGAVQYRLGIGAGTGVVKFGQLGVYNLSRLGLVA